MRHALRLRPERTNSRQEIITGAQACFAVHGTCQRRLNFDPLAAPPPTEHTREESCDEEAGARSLTASSSTLWSAVEAAAGLGVVSVVGVQTLRLAL